MKGVTMNILGYVLTVFNYLFYCISRFKKEKHQILYIDIISKLFVIASLQLCREVRHCLCDKSPQAGGNCFRRLR